MPRRYHVVHDVLYIAYYTTSSYRPTSPKTPKPQNPAARPGRGRDGAPLPNPARALRYETFANCGA
eukprot:1192180-Prorocentrum_minimum.AAC.6